MDEKKKTLGKPHGYLLLLFGLEIILVASVYLAGGITFFNNDPQNVGIFLPLGILTFVSIFFSFIFLEGKKFLNSFKSLINKKEKEFEIEFKKLNYRNPNEIQDYLHRHHDLKEYQWFVRPFLWLSSSVFLSIFSVLANFIDKEYKGTIVSILIHLSILTMLFLVTSVVSIVIAHLSFSKEK